MEQNDEIKEVPEVVEGTEQNLPAEGAENAATATSAEAPASKVYGDKVLTKAQKTRRTILRWTLMTAGIIMMAISVFFFQTPNGFTLGGVAGVALLLQYAFNNPYLTQGVFIAIINVILIILGLIILGKQCTVRTIYCSLLYTAVVWGLEQLIGPGNQPVHVDKWPLTDQPFMELCYAILLFGIGGAIVFNCGSTSGGTDIIAMIMKKYTKLNVGVSLLIIDFIVVCITFSSVEVEIALYSMLGLFAKSFLLDGIIESIGKTKYITIITQHPDEIADYILTKIKHSYTIYDAEGGYSKEPKKVMVTVCKRSEALKLKTKVKSLDPEAFVIITDANEILGKGFGGTL